MNRFINRSNQSTESKQQRQVFQTKALQSSPPPPTKVVGFQDTNKEVVATRGVKIRNKGAEIAEKEKLQKEEYLKNFNQRADKTVQYNTEKNKRVVECISKLMTLADDKTISQNRGSIATDVEKEIRQNLIQMALDLNNDENEEDNGKGSIVVLSAFTKILMMYRDRLNDLEYEMARLKAELKKRDSSSGPQRGTQNADQ